MVFVPIPFALRSLGSYHITASSNGETVGGVSLYVPVRADSSGVLFLFRFEQTTQVLSTKFCSTCVGKRKQKYNENFNE
jgi:hypothetical protein